MSSVKIKLNFSSFLLILFLSNIISKSIEISIDNDIIGEPDIECLDQEIRVWIKTRKVFAGRIYAKGRADDSDCAKDDFAQQRTKKPHFDLNLGMCGMKSLRSFDPRGMYYGITLVVSFHPLFITKVDQAFHVKCFFEEANRGLTAELGVSMIPTTEVEARHGIPGCTYSIHRSSIDDLDIGKPPGAPIQFAKVGDKVLHQWHCDDQMFGILINNCYVTDGVNKRADVIDSRGCPVDPILITGIRYSDDMQRAYAESQVFKFADRPGVWFFCQIQMCMKKEGMCNGITPPACAGSPVSIGNGGNHNNHNFFGSTIDEDDDDEIFTTRHKTKKHKKNKFLHGSVDEEVEEFNNEDYNNKETYQTKRPKHRKKTDYEDEDYSTKVQSNRSNKQRIPSYGLSSNPDYDLHAKEPVTVFGPGLAPGVNIDNNSDELSTLINLKEPKSSEKTRSEIVSTEFETNDDLSKQTTSTTTGVLSLDTTTITTVVQKDEKEKKDYVDYDSEASIPKSLNELLSNLSPEELNGNNLQKMFKDSVADRRALLDGFDKLINQMKDSSMPKPPPVKHRRYGRMPGEKIDTMHVSWESQRMARDLPISTEANTPKAAEDPDAPPMIAGQLLIYDLDETPPPNAEQEQEIKAEFNQDCAISKQGLMVLSMALGSIAFVLMVIILALFLKLKNSKNDNSYFSNNYGSSSSSKLSLTSNSSNNDYPSNLSIFKQSLSLNNSILSQRRL